MSADRKANAGGFLSKVASWMTSFAGITTAIATIMTSASAVLGLLVHRQSVQLQQAHSTVSQQARQIHALKDGTPRQSPAATASAPPTAASSPSAAQLTSVTHYLSDLTPTVDNGNVSQVNRLSPHGHTRRAYCFHETGAPAASRERLTTLPEAEYSPRKSESLTICRTQRASLPRNF